MKIRKILVNSSLLAVLTAWLAFGLWANDKPRQPGDYLAQARAMTGPGWPVSTGQRPTTSGAIYLANLNGQIAELKRLNASQAENRFAPELAKLLYHRFQLTGRLEDAESALLLISGDSQKSHANADLISARILMGFHEFDKALLALEQAEKNGAPKTETAAVRRAVSGAQGADIQSKSDVSPTPENLVSQAAAWVEQGRPDKASELLRMAQDQYIDSSPFTLAWIHVQQGIIFLDNQDYATARQFFAAANERFPQYTLAAEHLAETELALGNHEVAAILYRNVVEQSEHPEFYHQLSRAEILLGNKEESQQAALLAQQGYDQLTEEYPLMFADHAVGYYIDIGDRATAISLAETNLEQRQNRSAKLLLATARECCR